MTAPRVGDAFHLDLDGTVIAGRNIEIDPPHRLVIEWDRPATGKPTSAPTCIEITLTRTGNGTTVKVQWSGLSAAEAAFHQRLWARHLDRIAAAFVRGEPGALPSNGVPEATYGHGRSTPYNQAATEQN
jgi:uncharacterized protein YndB with AHSA1/START domain